MRSISAASASNACAFLIDEFVPVVNPPDAADR